MRAVIQRVKSASVTVDNKLISQIGRGLLVLVGVSRDDTTEDAEKIANRILRIKLWEDPFTLAPWKTNVAELKIEEDIIVPATAVPATAGSTTEATVSKKVVQTGQVLCVSQFTLLASVKKGAKPDFHKAAKGDQARDLYAKVLELVAQGMPNGVQDVKDGVFGAMMDVALVNDGPVTIEIDSRVQ